MIDQLFMNDLAKDLAPPLEPVEQPATLLASGPATSDVGQVTVQGFNPGQDTAGGAFVGTRLNTPKAGQPQPTQQDREKLAIGLLDSLAGALRGATAQTIGLPGDIRSIVDMINKEGADKYLGQPVLPTTEEMMASKALPPVLGEGATNIAERLPTVEAAQEVGTFLPAPGIPEVVVKGAKLVGKAIKATKGLPVGMSTQAVGEGVDELGFYSAARQAVDAIQQPKGTGEQFLKQIEKTPGVKPDEIKWTGLDDFLKSKKTVTKAEVQEYLDKNKVEIKEVQLGGIKLNEKSEYALPEVMKVINENQGDDFDRIRLALVNDYDAYQALTKKFPNLEDTDNWGDRVLEDVIGSAGGGGPKFSKYTLPGGENYREVLLTLPVKPRDGASIEQTATGKWRVTYKDGDSSVFRTEQEARNAMGGSSSFTSQHFDQPNILAHMRVNDRVIDGKKTLFVEEVQSDWHQAGRKKGYVSADQEKAKKDIQNRMSELNTERKPLNDRLILLQGAVNKDAYADEITELQGKLNDIQREYAPLANQLSTGLAGVPDAPFKTTWSELAMKRAIQMASEGGYDRIAFTTGKTQAERFDLSKQINDVTAERLRGGSKEGQYSITATDKDGNLAVNEVVPEDRLEDFFGKDLAKKIVDDAPDWPDGKKYTGVDLSVGGEGMKGFYDDILPKFLNKYGKKWDAKVGMTDVVTDDQIEIIKANAAKMYGVGSDNYKQAIKNYQEPVHYMDITPKMRESTLTKGQPMFAIGAGGAGAAATQQEENK